MILHICSYYIGNKLYKNLVENISLKQIVYVPLKSEKFVNINATDSCEIIYDSIIQRKHRFLYKSKVQLQLKQIEQKVDVQTIDLIHAHTWFSDGGTAYLLNKKYNTPYIINVRNTDLNYFFKYAIHLRKFGYKILRNAKQIVFLSNAYLEIFKAILPKQLISEITEKCVVVPNAVEQNWIGINPSEIVPSQKKNNLSLTFVGTINANKNLETALKLFKYCQQNLDTKISFNVIGDGDLLPQLKETYKDPNIYYWGKKDKEEIKKILINSTIFIMPSITETFGIVYLEAMGTGTPVIYTRNQGFDNLFQEGEVGYAVDPYSIQEQFEAINLILANYEMISKNCYKHAQSYTWANIAKQYETIYLK